ncbi:MAG: hypothetical protein JNM95_14890 [Chitinophagaceae bacterium]|nr:hypothetical protein [Chitinophagaceae bacterium]
MKRLITVPFAVFIICIGLWSSCKKEVVPPEDISIGQEYFPTELGHFVEYQVDSFLFNDFTKKVDTFKYEIKDVITDTFTDNENRLSHIVTRYKRYSSSEAWTENLVYYVTKTPYRVEVVEQNLRFIKLVFPVKENVKWYGNSYIPTKLNSELAWLDQWYYKYDRISLPFTSGILIFNDGLVVNENDYSKGNPELYPDEYAAKIFAKEAYAKGVGLVYREIENWDYQATTTKYRHGFKIIYRAKNYN